MATEGVTVANAFVQVMPSMEGATSNITNALTGAMSGAGDAAGGLFGNAFTGKLGGAIKTIGPMIAGVFAVDKLADSFAQVEEGLNNLKKATGATGESAKELESVYLDVSSKVVGSFGDIGSAVGEINTRLGLNGEELEKASESMMKYAKVTGQDATKATQDVASMMRNVGIPTEELSNTLGKLTVAGQAAGIDVSNLANNVTKYNAVMKQLGLSTDEQIALMAKFEVSGADTASILNAMKKGVAEWAKEGKDARTEFDNFVQGVQNGTVTAGDAVEIFGSRGGLSMFEAAQKGQLAFDDMFQTISNASEENLDEIYRDTLTASEKFELMGKSLQVGFFEIMEPIVDAISPYIDDIVEAVRGGVDLIVTIVKPFMEYIGTIINELKGPIGEVFGLVFDWVKKYVAPALSELGGFIASVLQPVIGALGDIIINFIVPAFRDIFDWVDKYVIPTLGDLFHWVNDNIIPVFGWLADSISTVIGWIQDFIGWITSAIDSANQFNAANSTYSTYDADPWSSGYYGFVGYATGGFTTPGELYVANERGGEFIWPSYEPYASYYADMIASRIGTGVEVTGNTFVIREEADIRKVAVELNRLIDRQGAVA